MEVSRVISGESAGDLIELGAIRVDTQTRRVTVDDQTVALTPTEFRLLEVLLRHPGRAFTRSELVTAIVSDAIVEDRTIDVHVWALRRKLGARAPRIEPVRGVGYRLQEKK